MNALPDIATYAQLGALAPEPDEDDGTCAWCGDYPCRPDCRPPSVRGEAPDGPQGAEHYLELEERGL